MDKSYNKVKIILKPSDDQVKDIELYFDRFKELCIWLNENCPSELKKYRDVYSWAYPKLRRKGAYAQMIGKIAGKVSQHRIKKLEMDCNYILCDNKMFLFEKEFVRIKLLDKKVKFKYEIASGKNTKKMVYSCLQQSGVFQKADTGYIFHLRVNTPRVMVYSR